MKLLSAALLALPAAVPAQAQRWTPDAGTRAYTLEIVERIATRPDRTTRLDYDLIADGKGSIVAVVRSAETAEGGPAKPIEIDQACRTALDAGPGEVARVTLAPLPAGDPLAAIAPCAPPMLFMPLGEVVRVAMVQLAPSFGLASLKRPGQSHRFGPFASHVDRPAMKLDLEAGGGTTRFVRLSRGRATVEWIPDSMRASMINRDAIPGTTIRGEGSARVAIRLEIDRKTGALLEAASIEDSATLMLDIKDAPPIRLEVTRQLTVRPRRP
jgi:hypothetical protein